MAESVGLDPAEFLSVLEGGPLDAPYAQLKGKAVAGHEYPVSFALAHTRKDAHLSLDGAGAAGLSLAVGGATARLFDAALDAGYGDNDLSAAREWRRPIGD